MKNNFLCGSIIYHHHSPGERPGGQSEKPEKVRKTVEYQQASEPGIPIKPGEKETSPGLREEREALERPYANERGFDQNPEKKATKEHLQDFFSGKTKEISQIWRFLSVPRRMQYLLIQEPHAEIKRIKFLKMHRSEVMANYAVDIRFYSKIDAIKKVPLVSLSAKERNEIQTDRRIFLMGGTLSQAMSGDTDLRTAEARDIGGAGDPVKALAAFQSKLASRPDEELKGATVVISFDPDMFTSGMSLKQMTDATTELLSKINGKGMRIVMTTPLPVSVELWTRSTNYIGGGRPQKEAMKIRKDYLNFMAEMYQKGYMHSVVDVAKGMQKRLRGETEDFKLVYYNDSYDLNKGLNAEGLRVSVNGVIDGINLANGTSTGRTNAGGELHYYGAGDNYSKGAKRGTAAGRQTGHPPTVELIPDHESIQSVSGLPEKVRMALWRLSYLHMCADLQLVKLDEDNVKAETDIVQRAVDELTDPDQKKFARLEFMRQKASIYYMYAWKALKRRDFAKVPELVKDAREKNREFHDTQVPAMFKARLNRLERAANQKAAVAEDAATPAVHKGEKYPDFKMEKKKK